MNIFGLKCNVYDILDRNEHHMLCMTVYIAVFVIPVLILNRLHQFGKIKVSSTESVDLKTIQNQLRNLEINSLFCFDIENDYFCAKK